MQSLISSYYESNFLRIQWNCKRPSNVLKLTLIQLEGRDNCSLCTHTVYQKSSWFNCSRTKIHSEKLSVIVQLGPSLRIEEGPSRLSFQVTTNHQKWEANIQNSTWKRGTHARKTHASRARQNACKRVNKSFIFYFAVSKIVSNYASMFGALIILITHLWIS